MHNIFPARFDPATRQYQVSAMESVAYGPAYGDPKYRKNAIIPPDMLDHGQIHDWLDTFEVPRQLLKPRQSPHLVTFLGGPNHGPVHTKPTTLLIQFYCETKRRAFAERFGF